MAFVLDQLKPNQKYFEAICGIPHPSTEEKAVSDYVCSVAEKLGLNYEQDKFWNVIVRKPASKGYEDAPVVMLEGHMDMVCVKTPESTHDFSHDPIEIYVDDKGDIRAKDTTLGADDGYGVAYMLAVMEEDPARPVIMIHQNTFSEPVYSGAQMFYGSENPASRALAESVRQSVVSLLQPDNTRELKPAPSDVWILNDSLGTCSMIVPRITLPFFR